MTGTKRHNKPISVFFVVQSLLWTLNDFYFPPFFLLYVFDEDNFNCNSNLFGEFGRFKYKCLDVFYKQIQSLMESNLRAVLSKKKKTSSVGCEFFGEQQKKETHKENIRGISFYLTSFFFSFPKAHDPGALIQVRGSYIKSSSLFVFICQNKSTITSKTTQNNYFPDNCTC